MKDNMSMEEFRKQASELLRQGKPLTGKDGIFTPLLKQVIEASLEGEMDAHLEETREDGKNRRNGRMKKTLKSSAGAFEVFTPRDRAGTYDPQTVGKRQTLLPGDLEEKILALYGLGMGYRDMRRHIAEMYGVEISEGSINQITDRVIPAIRDWQSRPLERLYPIVWLDAMHFKIRQDGLVVTKAIYTVLGATPTGRKEVLGLYLGEHESATFWLQVLTDIQQRGVEDILIASIDNLKGFAEAIEHLYPRTEVQLCVIHQIRNSLKYIAFKNQRAFMRDLKQVYRAGTLSQAAQYMDQLEVNWGKMYPLVIKSWRQNWDRLTQYFKYPPDIRKLIYTTNTVEGYHRMVRKVTKTKGAFTSDMAVMKLIYLATINFNKRWDEKPIYNWATIFNALNLYFEDRIKPIDTV